MPFFLGVTRKQLGLTFFGETKENMGAVVGDIRIEVEGIDRKVSATFSLSNLFRGMLTFIIHTHFSTGTFFRRPIHRYVCSSASFSYLISHTSADSTFAPRTTLPTMASKLFWSSGTTTQSS